MKKVGIITLNGNENFGNRLQNYALQETIKKINGTNNVETLWNNSGKNKKYIKDDIKILLSIFVSKYKKIYINRKRENVIKRFTDNYINVHYFNNKEINSLDDIYDMYVVGSDQIWSSYSLENDVMSSCSFSKKNYNISYAASFGGNSLTEKAKKILKDNVKRFKAISVREDAGIKILKDATGMNGIKVPDPTLLLDDIEWKKIEKKKKVKKKYIFLYFLGGYSENVKEIIKNNYAEYEVIDVLNEKSKYYNIGPDEFLYLIDNAECVLTDSFHACVFSIIFNKKFIVFDRNNTKINMNSRIVTLLNDFDLQQNYIKNITNIDEWKNQKYDRKKICEKVKKEGIDYLNKELS